MEPWICPNCKVGVRGDFEYCPRCGNDPIHGMPTLIYGTPPPVSAYATPGEIIWTYNKRENE